MTPTEAAWVRAHAWPQWMRDEHASGAAALRDPRPASSWWCGRGRCSECAPYRPAAPETYIRTRGGHIARMAAPYAHPARLATGREAIAEASVWLADRVCPWRCACTCGHDRAEIPPGLRACLDRVAAGLPGDREAAWIRERVLPAALAAHPGLASCACQWSMPMHCSRLDRHGRCARGTPLPVAEGHVLRPGGEYAAEFAAPYAHPHESATGRHPSHVAMVWLADRVCRWVCSCGCHTAPAEPVQEALFAI